jgi:hypothetical protein
MFAAIALTIATIISTNLAEIRVGVRVRVSWMQLKSPARPSHLYLSLQYRDRVKVSGRVRVRICAQKVCVNPNSNPDSNPDSNLQYNKLQED